MTPHGWTVMLPVKSPRAGKSRLGRATPERAALAEAIALDTIAAVLETPGVAQVLVVTADDAFARRLPRSVVIVPEPRVVGIDPALARAAARVGESVARAALPADLAALQPDELAAALADAAAWPRTVVADAEGTGTTLLTAGPGVPWRSAYGPGSYVHHRALGCRPLLLPVHSGLRRDLDTPAQLAAAAPRLGARTRLTA